MSEGEAGQQYSGSEKKIEICTGYRKFDKLRGVYEDGEWGAISLVSDGGPVCVKYPLSLSVFSELPQMMC